MRSVYFAFSLLLAVLAASSAGLFLNRMHPIHAYVIRGDSEHVAGFSMRPGYYVNDSHNPRCYWAVIGLPPTSEIQAERWGGGHQVVVVLPQEAFETYGCGSWTATRKNVS